MKKQTEKIIKDYNEYVMATYERTPLVLVKGAGIYVWDSEGKKYLDFFPGWAVSGLGHCHKSVVNNLVKQAKKILHVPNNYYGELQGELAKVIVKHSFPGKVFFANSGAEANEAAIKFARKYGTIKPAKAGAASTNRYEIITMEKSFHGRTLATLTATGQGKVKIGFAPLVEGFKIVPFNDLKAVEDALTDLTVAIMVEPIQGEGGINVGSVDYIRGLRKLCDEKDLLLIFDEVQTGMGRTGKMFAYQHYGIEPDLMTLAKSLGGGLPVGAMVAQKKIADILPPGSHASTFGGSPIVASAALGVFDAIEKEGLLKNTAAMGNYLVKELNKLKKKFPVIKEIRGKGLMIGVELSVEGAEIFKACIKRGLLINCTQKKVLRIMPPLTVTKGQIDGALEILGGALCQVHKLQ